MDNVSKIVLELDGIGDFLQYISIYGGKIDLSEEKHLKAYNSAVNYYKTVKSAVWEHTRKDMGLEKFGV